MVSATTTASNSSGLAHFDPLRLVDVAKVDLVMKTPGFDSFDLEVECEREVTGSLVKPIQARLDTLRAKPGLVTAYAKFTNVPPDVAKQKLIKGCR
ncbi:hypothetical protein N7539_008879 [Penicillium diatomitis]|uniref:Uncharacterized protein n=1 Tax=Penicillium diatomitis TaxID=2819901 RepID=A0A9W9WKP5_9EURO|nr:uncharacterized protein N7539_008879 [Penicillium diatomitis]KAJ5469261.1 hypothetical protein N7539_008879 [Penicillium diatomitis]